MVSLTVKKRSKHEKKSGEMNKRIWIGLSVFVVFIVIFTLTINQPMLEEETPFEQLSPQERLDYVQKSNEATENTANYQRAKLYNDRAYCDSITDNKIRTACLAEVKEYAPEEPEDTRTAAEKEDNTNYQRAKLYGEVEYCDFISDAALRSKCVSELS